MSPLSPGALQQRIDQVAVEVGEGHGRLREELNKVQAHQVSLDTSVIRHDLALTRIDSAVESLRSTPVSISNLNFPLPTVVLLILFCVALVGGQVANLAIQSGRARLEDDRAGIVKELQEDLRKQAKLEDLREADHAREVATLTGSIAALHELLAPPRRR